MRRRKHLLGSKCFAARAVVGGATLVASLLIAVGSAHGSGLPTPALSEVPVPPAAVAAPPPAPAAAPAPVAQPVPAAIAISAGEQYVISDKDLCSTGFAVTAANGQGGFVSAGHCGEAGNAVQDADGTAIGTFAASNFPGTDYGWVVTNERFAATPTVSRHNGTVVAVHGDAPASIGAPVCMSGQASGWHCGTITAVNQTVEYDQGLVSGLTATSVCSDGGDSGGAFVSVDQAQGIVSGGIGDCASDGTTYFQPLGPILTAYGLSLRTS